MRARMCCRKAVFCDPCEGPYTEVSRKVVPELLIMTVALIEKLPICTLLYSVKVMR